MVKCVKLPVNKEPHLSIRKDAENAATTANVRTSKKNESSPQRFREHLTSNHSTPLRQKQRPNNMESPDIDGYISPICPPCTQEGYNEILWDWQTSLNRTPDSRSKKQIVHCETPKGSKLLHRKRNSNSPLLYKSELKRKTIKMENIENIGQFAAELQALNEKMRLMKQNSKNYLGDQKSATEDTGSNEETNSLIKNIKCEDRDDYNNATRASLSYDELFDDSIDDSMIRCTQEIEEKFNFIVVKENSNMYSCTKEEGSSSKDNIAVKDFISQSPCKEKLEDTSVKTSFRRSSSESNTLRTYSRLSSKKTTSSSVLAVCQNENLHRSCLNNNNIEHCHVRKSYDDKKLTKNIAAKLFDIPDDSFDDCLAICVEKEELVSRSRESNDVSACGRNDAVFGASYKYLTQAPLKGEFSFNGSSSSAVPKAEPTVKTEMSAAGALENRKFFKTKSLSDQYICQNVIANAKLAHATSTSYATKSKSHLSSLSTNLASRRKNDAFVSTKQVDMNIGKIEESRVSLMRSAGRTHGSDNVNRSAVRTSGDRLVKYNSTGNMKSETAKAAAARIGSQPTRCTAEEIEKKRLQAIMRLEARRKLYAVKNCNIR